MSGRQPLEAYLRAHQPRDILIPCAAGEKRPLFPYSNNSWTWEKYDVFCASQESVSSDWAIILSNLCVIDVDDALVASQLEQQFPALLSAPCASTSRGFHYFFRRSALAQEKYYWDGCGQQLVAAVDYKSVTPTGTGGIRRLLSGVRPARRLAARPLRRRLRPHVRRALRPLQRVGEDRQGGAGSPGNDSAAREHHGRARARRQNADPAAGVTRRGSLSLWARGMCAQHAVGLDNRDYGICAYIYYPFGTPTPRGPTRGVLFGAELLCAKVLRGRSRRSGPNPL